jgi:hypothetical protein
MSQPIKDGGPAYPVSPEIYNGTGLCGMTLRDYFAAAALQGNLIEPTANNDEVAKWAYSLADAMLKAREAK